MFVLQSRNRTAGILALDLLGDPRAHRSVGFPVHLLVHLSGSPGTDHLCDRPPRRRTAAAFHHLFSAARYSPHSRSVVCEPPCAAVKASEPYLRPFTVLSTLLFVVCRTASALPFSARAVCQTHPVGGRRLFASRFQTRVGCMPAPAPRCCAHPVAVQCSVLFAPMCSLFVLTLCVCVCLDL
jgi:hypothetical protein